MRVDVAIAAIARVFPLVEGRALRKDVAHLEGTGLIGHSMVLDLANDGVVAIAVSQTVNALLAAAID